eukprot:maker-scaffold86_size395752-snap-gene-2.34 protein:Tk10887 transcript:maker-scaffold86_size395752-snap-gene-2.34-mRNA-1 annotation:"conserved hypothetical protein"
MSCSSPSTVQYDENTKGGFWMHSGSPEPDPMLEKSNSEVGLLAVVGRLGVSRTTVYAVKQRNDIDRKPGSGKTPALDKNVIKTAIEADPLKSLRKHAADMNVAPSTMSMTVQREFPDGNVVLQQDGAPAHTGKVAQKFLADQSGIMKFWDKTMWPPYSSDADPLDYSFWPHVEGKACRVRDPNVEALKASVKEHWAGMEEGYIVKVCQAFRKRLEAIILAEVLSLFNIVTFKNEACQSNNVIRFGVCCIFTAVNSGSTITQNCTYIRNPGFPQTYEQQSSITYTIRKTAPDVCSLRLDFESFSILATGNTLETNTILIPPTTGGICLDQLNIVLSSGVSVPTICGQNSGEHIYLDIGNQATSRAQLNFVFDAQVSNIRQWEIKAVQIPCTSSVPQGCLQYHTGASGTLRTFNFLNNADNHLANQDYSICIRQEAGFCCVEYLPCVDVNAFSLDVQA